MSTRKQRPKTASHRTGSLQLRIIAGKWRGRRLHFAAVEGLRPTGDRIRETLFNWLMADIAGARCLDLFSGSGALGLEALSRGASMATLLELDSRAARQLRENLTLLQADNAELVQTDALQWLQQQTPLKPYPQQEYSKEQPQVRPQLIENQQQAACQCYDLVFLDPPFALNLCQTAVQLLDRGDWLCPGAQVYIECPVNTLLQVPANWQMQREKRAGEVVFRLYRLQQCLQSES